MMRRYRMFMIGWPEPTEVLVDIDEALMARVRPTSFLRGKLCLAEEGEAEAHIPINRIQLLVEAE